MNGTNCCGSQCIDLVGFNGNIDEHEEEWLSCLSLCVSGEDMFLNTPINSAGGEIMNEFLMNGQEKMKE